MKERNHSSEVKIEGKDVLNHITPVIVNNEMPGSVEQALDTIINYLGKNNTVVWSIIGNPLNTKSTVIRSALKHILEKVYLDEIPYLEWGFVTGEQGLSFDKDLKTASRRQRDILSKLVERYSTKSEGDQRGLIVFESPAMTSFAKNGLITMGSDRGLSSLISLAHRDLYFQSRKLPIKPFDFKFVLWGLIAEPLLEHDMLLTRAKIAREPKNYTATRKLFKSKGIDTSGVTNEELTKYGFECATNEAILGIKEQNDSVIMELNERGTIQIYGKRYFYDQSYRSEVIARTFMPKLFESIRERVDEKRYQMTSEPLGRIDSIFVGKVHRAQRLRMEHLDDRVYNPVGR